MIKEKLRALIADAISLAGTDKKLVMLPEALIQPVIEKPRSAEHGDYSCGVALKLAGPL
jgi:arginyl-tRNA synthetase